MGEAQAKLDTVPNHSSRQSIAGDDNYNEDYEPVEEAPEEDIEAGAHLKSPDNLYGYPVFPPDCKSLLKKYLSREVWQCLKNAKDKHGFGFKQAIFSGC